MQDIYQYKVVFLVIANLNKHFFYSRMLTYRKLILFRWALIFLDFGRWVNDELKSLGLQIPKNMVHWFVTNAKSLFVHENILSF